MKKMKSSYILLKEHLEMKDYEHITALQKDCIEFDDTSLKLELDYKMKVTKGTNAIGLQQVNEFLYYIEDQLVGYIGICSFSGSEIEVNGMVHPDYRRKVFLRASSNSLKKSGCDEAMLKCYCFPIASLHPGWVF